MKIEYLCDKCKTINNIYNPGQYKCIKCKEIFFINTDMEVEINEVTSDEIRRESSRKTPNFIPLKTRICVLILSLIFIIYTIFGISNNDLVVPLSKRGRTSFHLHGIFMYLGAIGIVCFIASMISVIVDHYDKRNNEYLYEEFQTKLINLAFIVFVSAAFLQIIWQIILLIIKAFA